MRVRYEYDGFYRPTKLARRKGGVEKATNFDFAYDVLDRVTQVTDPLNRSTNTDYEPFCVSSTTTTPRGVTRQVDFDNLCQLSRLKMPGEIREFSYDELGRVYEIRQKPGQDSKYSNPASVDPEQPHGKARYQESAATQTWSILYDSLDRVTKVTFPDTKTIQYEYDSEGNVTKVTDPHGNITLYSYYTDDRLYQVTVQRRSQTDRVFTYSYDSVGRPYEVTYPSSTGIVLKFYDGSNNSGWDANGQLTYMRYVKGASLLQAFQYAYDDSGNRKQFVDITGSSVTWDYSYDWLGRLSTVSKNGAQQYAYVYDESDNRVTVDFTALASTHTFTYDIADQVSTRSVNSVQAETYTHDADGNLTSRTAGGVTTTYSWNDDNRLYKRASGSNLQEHRYDAGGIRKSTKPSTTYYSSGGASLADIQPGGNLAFLQADQIRGHELGGSFYYYLTDVQSSVRLIVDSSGNVQSSFAYKAFGDYEGNPSDAGGLGYMGYVGGLGVRNDLENTGAGNSNFGPKLLYMRQRWYDPGLGRWLSQDPIGFAGGLNLYAGMGNNPVNGVDPSGLIGEDSLARAYFRWALKRLGVKVASGTVAGLGSGPAAPILEVALWATAGAEGVNLLWQVVTKTAPQDVLAKQWPEWNRCLVQKDLGLKGNVKILQGELTFSERTMTARVDMIKGDITNPLRIFDNLKSMAESYGARTLQVEGTLANERLLEILQARYGMVTAGSVETIVIPLK